MRYRGLTLGIMLSVALAIPTQLDAQRRPLDAQDPAATVDHQRTRLILRNGTYQLVLSYKVNGNVVEYRSAERNGELEEVPLKLVDMPATLAWYHQQVEGVPAPQQDDRPVLSPELAKEEADRAAYSPEVAPNLELPQELSVVVMDTFEGTPELVPVPQYNTDLNPETAHAVLKQVINPHSSPHQILELQRPQADVQLHVPDPVFFVRVGNDLPDTGGGFTVDTHGATGRETPSGGDAGSAYVIERLDAMQYSRILDSFKIDWLNSGRRQPDIIETREQDLPGGHWLKLTPTRPLDFGEYALVEVVSGHELNLNVWDFGVHSGAKENVEAIRPETRRPATLTRRKP
ncbi:hypothetical protein GOB94_09835 [Granulicella sp. 5B5]|nr:hypothetical protein GOB94_09835 [Granulicella sp. 5B5]